MRRYFYIYYGEASASMSSSELGLQATSVSYRYEGLYAVRDVSLSVASGQAIALCGPNGSGKTTLLRLLSSTLHPHDGTVLLNGRNIARYGSRERARLVAVVPQRVSSYVMYKVRDLVAMGRTPYLSFFGQTDVDGDQAIAEAIEYTSIESMVDKRFDELSGGEQQRVMLAAALAQRPHYLLLDEPTVHLDVHHQHTFMELLGSVRLTHGIGIVAVMHDLNLTALYFDSILAMHRGIVIAEGPPGELLSPGGAMLRTFDAPLVDVMHPSHSVPQVLLRRDD